MNCDAVAEFIEPLAAGEIECSAAVEAQLMAHLDVCPRCAAELAAARAINGWLLSGRVEAPRHLTAAILQRLPSRGFGAPHTGRARDTGHAPDHAPDQGVDAWFDVMAALSTMPVLAGIWFLVSPAALRRLVETTARGVSETATVLLHIAAIPPAYVAIAAIGVLTLITLEAIEEA